MGFFFFFFQAEDGIRDVERSRGLGDVYKRQVSTQSTWELNTNENIGVISAMMSDRIIEGKRVPKNIRFMAACNPFRLAKPNESSVIGFAPREDLSHKLEYRVFPLPETLTEYSWDIGAVSYTHLTLPTILLVQISVVAVSLKKKKTYTPPASNGPYTRTHHITTPHIRPIY
eukprot:TRINITY_DN1865_c0_g1_i4.p1 TRINITY_DN1865_c0_g1~~TRINITY_DN1865_c0_g1_i4.p1  ORF type:complete len:172 (+),score=46.09 TRINITY_DN1865_c0_g1_i4:104-619(+)